MPAEGHFSSQDALEIYRASEQLGARIWIDGGWGVDALLGAQTRPHKDLDIAIQEKDVAKLRGLLKSRGYKEVKLEIARPHNFVMGDANGNEVDVHVIVLDDHGNGIYGPLAEGLMYPAAALAGIGTIDGHRVRCISAEWMVRFHSGYELTEKDFRDVSALCERFAIEMPEEYIRLKLKLQS